MINLDEKYPEGNMVFGEGNQVLAKLCFHETLRRNAGHRVQTAKICKSGLPASPIGGRAILFKTFRSPDDRAAAVANRIGSKNDGNTVSILVEDGYVHDRGFSVPKGEINGIVWIRIEVIRTVAGSQQVVAQETPDNVLPEIPSNLFRAFVPKADSPVPVNNVNASFETFQDDSLDFRVV